MRNEKPYQKQNLHERQTLRMSPIAQPQRQTRSNQHQNGKPFQKAKPQLAINPTLVPLTHLQCQRQSSRAWRGSPPRTRLRQGTARRRLSSVYPW